jgi:hypothetical protein
MGISGGAPGSGGPFAVLATANANLTIPNGVRFGFVSVRSDTAPVTVTLPLIQGSQACGLILSCPDGAANNVTINAAATNTIFTGAGATVAGDNLVVLVGVPGATDWQGHVGT